MTNRLPTWSRRDLVIEALLNLPGLTIPLIVAWVIGVSLSWFAAVEWRQLDDQVAEASSAGWATYAVEAEGAQVSASECVDLRGFDGVQWAAATNFQGDVGFLGGTQAPLRGIVGSPASDRSADLYLGRDLAERLSVGTGGRHLITVEHGAHFVTVALDGQGTDLGGTVLVPSLFPRADACYFKLHPSWVDRYEAVMLSQLGSFGDQPLLRRLAVIGDFEVGPYDRYVERQGRWFPIAGAAVVALLASVTVLRRGSEIATYRIIGTRSVDVAFMVMVEVLVISLILVGSAVATSQFLGTWPPGHSHRVASAGFALLVMSWPAAVAVATRSVSVQLKDR